jgi:WD40 repeat protein
MLAACNAWAQVTHLIDVDSVIDSNRKTKPAVKLPSEGLISCLGIAWSPDGKLLARLCTTTSSKSPVLELWRLPNGDDPEHIVADPLGRVPFQGKTSAFQNATHGVAFSPDSDLVAVGGLKKPQVFRLYSVSRSEFVAESAPLGGQVTELAFSPDGLEVFSGDDSGNIVVWGLKGSERPSLVRVDSAVLGQPIVGLAVDRDTKTVCIASASKKTTDLFTTAFSA